MKLSCYLTANIRYFFPISVHFWILGWLLTRGWALIKLSRILATQFQYFFINKTKKPEEHCFNFIPSIYGLFVGSGFFLWEGGERGTCLVTKL